jgi:ATP-dependent Clp protease ATP-binding subunit ClpC
MFERFTDRARRVVVLAQEEARLLDHHYIGTEHLLLGLIQEHEGIAAKALESLGISLDGVRREVEEVIGRGEGAPTSHIPFTPRAKKVLEMSLREALQLGHNYIGTEHILLGLIREGEGVAAQVLQKLGADLKRVRQTVIQLLADTSVEHVSEPPAEVGFTTHDDPAEVVDLVFTPVCPGCQAPVGSGATLYRSMAVPAEGETESFLEVSIVFCSLCGRTLGILPG